MSQGLAHRFIECFPPKLITMPHFVNKPKNKNLFVAVYDDNLHIFFEM